LQLTGMNDDTLFPDFPADARLWVYAADAPLSDAQQQALHAKLDAFFADWTSHGRPVRGAAQVVADRFLLVAATLEGGDISGCGIDDSVHAVDALADDLGIAWLSPLHVFYRDAAGQVVACSRGTFQTRVEEGAVTADTPVFDPSITTVEALREGQFEQPAGDAWHARVFDIPTPAASGASGA
jgi:hypothetical protein